MVRIVPILIGKKSVQSIRRYSGTGTRVHPCYSRVWRVSAPHIQATIETISGSFRLRQSIDSIFAIGKLEKFGIQQKVAG